jgi:mono/diheme cytochrome c family protein
VLLFACAAAFATVAWQKVFNDLYKPKAGTALQKAKCAACHMGAMGGALNPYGKLLQKKKVDAASLKAIGKVDADKDGASNIAEIKAGTLPGNPKSKPACK